MIVAVLSLKLLRRDVAVLEYVINHNPRALRSDLLTERQDTGIDFIFVHFVMLTQSA